MILKNEAKIKSILAEVNSEDSGLVYTNDERAIYLYKDGCLFPSVLKGEALSIHAAVPKQYRGQIAINSAKEVIQWAIRRFNLRVVVARIDKNRKNVNTFARLVGMTFYKENDRYNYYEVQNG